MSVPNAPDSIGQSRLSPTRDIAALATIANQQLQEKRYESALAIMQRIIGLQSTFDESAYLSLIEFSADQFFLSVAERHAKKLLAQKNTSRLAKFKTHLILSRLGQFFADEKSMVDNLAQAKKYCDAENPTEAKILNRRHYHVSLHLIKSSSPPAVVAEAFRAIEWRKNINWETSFIDKDYHQKIPQWDGRDLRDDETLLVSFEQGFGDAIQFSRFVTLIYPRAKKILFEVRAEMLHLFASQFNTAWQDKTPAPPQAEILVFPYGSFDQALAHPLVRQHKLKIVARVFLFSLPHLLQLSSPAVAMPYFSFEKLFAGRLPPPNESKRPKIGLVWSCGKDGNAQDRSINIKEFLPLLARPQYQFVSLQMPPQHRDIAAHGFGGFIADPSPLINNFADSAKILYDLAAVVSVDTAMAHLAAAFGKKTLLLTPFIADWRWTGSWTGSWAGSWAGTAQPAREPSIWYGENLFPFHYPRFHRGNQMPDWRQTIKKLSLALDRIITAS